VEEFNELHIRYTSVFCKQGEYSQLGTLFFENEIDALRAMTAEVVDWDVGPLLIIAAVYTLLACWSFGAALPTGLFIPCFIIGGALGYFKSRVSCVVCVVCRLLWLNVGVGRLGVRLAWGWTTACRGWTSTSTPTPSWVPRP
jgi:H+/Cl- antiporter ClcA